MKKILFLSFLFSVVFSVNLSAQKYKCLLQMNSYEGEGAYIVVSIIDPKGAYDQTLAVMGPDKKWYKNLKEWNRAQIAKPEKLSAITGASVSGGDRAMKIFNIPDALLNKGYKLRFESAVEDKAYKVNDVEIPLTTAGITEKADGKTYIKYVKLNKI